MRISLRVFLTLILGTVILLYGSGPSLSINGQPLKLAHNDETGELTIISTSQVLRINEMGEIITTINLFVNEYAYTSSNGRFILIAHFHKDKFPLVADLRFINSLGEIIWTKNNETFSSARVGNLGDVLTVAFLGEGPQAPAVITLFDSNGSEIGSWNIEHLGESLFSDNGKVVAINSFNEDILVFLTDTAIEIAQIPSTPLFTLSSDGSMLLSASNDDITCYSLKDANFTTIQSGIDIPRFILIGNDNSHILVAEKDDLSLLSLEKNYSKHIKIPNINYSITSVDVNSDLSLIAVGASDLKGSGSIWIFDSNLKLVGSENISIGKNTGNIPQVALFPDGRVIALTSEGILPINFNDNK
ncbi:MAG: hypothetical protein ACUVWP_01375 [bacterium]